MVFKKTNKKPAVAKTGACPSGSACCCCCMCGCKGSRTKKIIVKVLVVAVIVFATAKVTSCMVIRKMRHYGGARHAMFMKKAAKDCSCPNQENCECPRRKEGFFRGGQGRRGPQPTN